MNKTFLSEAIKRFLSDNPHFYKRIIRYAMIILILDVILFALVFFHLFPISKEYEYNLRHFSYALGTFLVSTFFTANLSTNNPELMSKDTKDIINQNDKPCENS